MSDIENKIYDIIVEKTGVNRGKLRRDAILGDLNISSLDFVEILFSVEETFDIEVPYNANTQDQDFKTLGDIISAVETLVTERD
ncbi:acyl carrier protein [Pararhodospirillum oryzae]|uniref:Acyl carrier protein n=1 Tax=Pararhodospirillum oryzae TaxID=478448 RepID=A0A512HA89_9PROT|nr:acyl carrier protein [Pararhodospirillum oryzae]GEO82355.1 acyl carrier protein [Pararhodospirillum oryzae]